MAPLKNIYSLSQLSPAKAARGHGAPFVGANEPNLHHYSLSHHLFVSSLSISKLRPRSSTQSYPFTSLRRRTCHVTNHIHMHMCKYDPVKYEPLCMTPDVTLALKFILALEPVPYQLAMACTVFTLILTVSHMPHHRSLSSVFVQAQFHPSITTSNSLFVPSIHICFRRHTIV
jgi:hypothetical protein